MAMKKLILSAALAAFAAPAMAHTGHDHGFGLLNGLAHPLMGADHLLAMVAVGLWSGFVLPRRVWAGAAAFLAAMLAGAGLAFAGVGFPMVEGAILASVVVFGLLTLIARRGQSGAVTAVSLAAIAAFALAHGHAHAAEAAGGALGYVAGFLAATAALHIAGIALAGIVAGRPLMQRALGAGIAASGLLMVAG
jgi:urease accessory protein